MTEERSAGGSATCPVCGNAFRPGDDVDTTGDHMVHPSCIDPEHKDVSTTSVWAAWGTGGQMAMGDPQRES